MTKIEKKVALRGSVGEIEEGGTSFNFEPIHGGKVRAFASRRIIDELTHLLRDGGDHARLLIKGIGVYRNDELDYLMQVDTVSLIPPLDVPGQLDEFRDMRDGWADGMQHPSGWGSGYGKAPGHQGLDWLADRFVSEYPDDLPLPRAYPTPEGGVELEWRIGRYDISLEVDIEGHVGEWNWVDLNSEDEGEKALDMDAGNDWEWVADELRHFIGGAN